MAECAGQAAVRAYAADVLSAGIEPPIQTSHPKKIVLRRIWDLMRTRLYCMIRQQNSLLLVGADQESTPALLTIGSAFADTIWSQ